MVIKANYEPREALEILEHLIEDDKKGTGVERAAALFQALPPFIPTACRLTDRSVFGRHLQQLLFEQARLELRYGRWDEALRCVIRLLRDAPIHARGHYLLGEILRQRNQAGDVPQALAHYFRAIASDPSFAEPHKAIGLIHFKEGEARLARVFFERALALAPLSNDNDYVRSWRPAALAAFMVTACSATIWWGLQDHRLLTDSSRLINPPRQGTLQLVVDAAPAPLPTLSTPVGSAPVGVIVAVDQSSREHTRYVMDRLAVTPVTYEVANIDF